MRQQEMHARSVGSRSDEAQFGAVVEEVMAQTPTMGHRQRLKTRFLAGEPESRSDVTLLELLLSYSIPQRDVRPLAERLLAQFSSLDGVLAADTATLCTVDGIAEHAAVLIKLCDLLTRRGTHAGASVQPLPLHDEPPAAAPLVAQPSLFDAPETPPLPEPPLPEPPLPQPPLPQPPLPVAMQATARQTHAAHGAAPSPQLQTVPSRSNDLVTKSVLREAIELLPRLPDTESLDEISTFLKNNLHFSAWQTRERYAAYIKRRMFPEGSADRALRAFAATFANQQELRDVAFYRFCRVEPLVARVVRELLLPAINAGFIERKTLRVYLTEQYPTSRSIADASQAVVETLVSGGIARADRRRLLFGYREVLLPAFAFILHSEFSTPMMYPLRDLEHHPVLTTMLWKPDQIMPALYELRNQGLITRISAIDSVRQFTLRHTLDSVVYELVAAEVRR